MIFKKAQLLGLVVLIEPFAEIHDAEQTFDKLSKSVKTKIYSNPSITIERIESHLQKVDQALQSERPYGEEARKDLQSRVDILTEDVKKIKTPAFKKYFLYALKELKTSVEHKGNISFHIGRIFTLLDDMDRHGIHPNNTTKATIKRELQNAQKTMTQHAVELDQSIETNKKLKPDESQEKIEK